MQVVHNALKAPNSEIGFEVMDVYVGSRLRIRRKALDMSQENVGKALGLTYQQVQKYESGINRISASRLFDLSRILEVPIAYFFDGGPEFPKKAAVSDLSGNVGAYAAASILLAAGSQEISSKPESIELIRAYYRIADPAVRNRIFDIINAISSPGKKT